MKTISMQARAFGARRLARRAMAPRVPPAPTTAMPPSPPPKADRPPLVRIRVICELLAQTQEWVEWQAAREDMPHYRTPRGPGGGWQLRFLVAEVLEWYDRKFGHNLPTQETDAARPLRPIIF